MKLSRKMLVFPALALGVAVFVLLMRTRPVPEQDAAVERVRVVRYIEAPRVAVVPRAVGYGNVQPGQVWEAVAEVGGKVVAMHKSLKKGAIIPSGAELLRIDAKEYELARSRAEAAVQNALAKLKELEQREANARRSLEVERASLGIAEQELARKRRLLASGTISRSEFDQQEQAYLAQQNAVQTYQSTLELIPAEREALAADLATARSQLENARLDLEKTVIRAPFECRIAAVEVELSQYVQPGQVVVEADSIGVSEVPAQVPIAAFRNLVRPGTGAPPLAEGIDMDRLRRFIGLDAVVRLDLAGGTVEWPATFSRLSETIDPETRTLGVYVTVDDTYLKATPGERPPLVKNMYCEVELRGKPRPESVVVPRSAVREGNVYLADEDDRLMIRPVTLDYTHADLASVARGLEGGERLVVTDVIPAVEGMKLDPVRDDDALVRLLAEATGEAKVR